MRELGADPRRALGVFPAAVPVDAGTPLQDRLLGLTGAEVSS